MSWCVQAAQLGAVASGFGGVRPLRQPAMPAARISSSSCLDAECLAIRKESGPWGAPTPRHWAHTERSGATAIRGVGVQASARGLAVTATYPPGHGHRDTRGMPERRFIHSSPASGECSVLPSTGRDVACDLTVPGEDRTKQRLSLRPSCFHLLTRNCAPEPHAALLQLCCNCALRRTPDTNELAGLAVLACLISKPSALRHLCGIA